MELPRNSTDISVDFNRPATVAALRELDPGLRLVLSKRLDLFQVYRLRSRARRQFFPSIGWVWLVEPMLVWEADVEPHMKLREEDDPSILIRQLKENDTQDEASLFVGGVRARDHEDKARRMIAAQREAAERKTHDNYRHAALDSMHQLRRAWEPFVNSPRFVR